MNPRLGYALRCCLAVVALTGAAAQAQKVNEFPKKTDPLHVKIDLFDKLMLGNHWNEGIIMQDVIFPPAGTEAPLVGSQEDVTAHTALYLVAYSYRYAITKDAKVREVADQLMDGILKLEKVTGVPGVVARSFNKTDKPLWHEQVYFFSQEWHASTSMPGYRWQGDLSSDKFTDLTYAMGIYSDLCADDAHKKLAADFIDRFVGRCVDFNFKLVDVDNKMTLWGNFCPDLPHQPLNSLEMLAGLKTAYRLTGKDRYRAAYHMLNTKYGYADEGLLAKTLWPDSWKVPWDDTLAAEALFQLLTQEDDPSLLQKYRMSLNRHWYEWKKSQFRTPDEMFFPMLYQALTGEKVMNEALEKALKGMWGFDREHRTFAIPGPDGPKQVASDSEGSATDMMRTYWFGRYAGLIDASW